MYDDLMSRLKNLSCIEIKNGEDVMPISAEAVKCIREIANEAADAIEQLFEKVEQLPRWIPVTERLPDNEEKLYLVTIDSYLGIRYTTTAYYAKNLEEVGGISLQGKRRGGFYGYIDVLGFLEKTGVRYWMPLPEPPKEEE